MSSRVMLQDLEALRLDSVRRYLIATGWKKRRLKAGYTEDDVPFELFTATTESNLRISLSLPLKFGDVDAATRLRDALQTLVDYEDRLAEELVIDIKSIGYDVLRSAIPSGGVLDDSIRFAAAKAYVNNMRALVASTAFSVARPRPFFAKNSNESSDFADDCRFGHTYRGSFGFVLEAPLPPPPTMPLLAAAVSPPRARQVMQRIARGMALIRAAVVQDSIDPLVNGYQEGFAANGCEHFASLINEVNPAGLNFSIHLSPDWKMESEADGFSFQAGPAHAEICLFAAKVLRRNDVDMPVKVSGRVIQMQNESDPTDVADTTGEHEIVVFWPSDIFGDLRVKVGLAPQDYLRAVRAHERGKAVSAMGTLKKSGRQYFLAEPRDFSIVEQLELSLTGAADDGDPNEGNSAA